MTQNKTAGSGIEASQIRHMDLEIRMHLRNIDYSSTEYRRLADVILFECADEPPAPEGETHP